MGRAAGAWIGFGLVTDNTVVLPASGAALVLALSEDTGLVLRFLFGSPPPLVPIKVFAAVLVALTSKPSLNAWQVFASALSSPTSYNRPSLSSLLKNRPLRFRTINTTDRAIFGFSRRLAIKYVGWKSRTKARKRRFPICEFVPPPRPHNTSFSVINVALSSTGWTDGGHTGPIGGSAMSKSTSEADLGGSTGDPPAAARSATADAMAARLAAGMSSSSPEPSVLSSSSENGTAAPATTATLGRLTAAGLGTSQIGRAHV